MAGRQLKPWLAVRQTFELMRTKNLRVKIPLCSFTNSNWEKIVLVFRFSGWCILGQMVSLRIASLG